MSDNTKAFIKLFEERFFIPQYQRGYRWEPQEVTELLDDLWQFEKTSNKGEFYCLQPIVVQKRDDGSCCVLDGQQRLTTLYLIVSYLEDICKQSNYTQPLFSLSYETRPGSEFFLREKKFTEGLNTINIDYNHITRAYIAIANWFSDPKHAGAKMKLVPILMDQSSKANRNVRFIWYEAEKHMQPIDVFVRLNVGKIPLTDAELVKALLLQTDKYSKEELKQNEPKLLEIANEWDSIEYALQSEDFWFFLNNHVNDRPTHIEFIFDLLASRINKEKKYFTPLPLKHATFLILSEYLQDMMDNEDLSRAHAVQTIWRQVSNYYEHFKNWFNNRVLFHYLGYLIAVKSNQDIDVFVERSREMTKSRFVGYLESEIGKSIRIQGELKDLRYLRDDDSKADQPQIHRILLLHNVYASLKSDKERARFPFNLYKHTKKKEKWSLEHIHAQNTDTISKRENQNTWLDDHIKSLSNLNFEIYKSIINRMKQLREQEKVEVKEFEEIVNELYRLLEKGGDTAGMEPHAIDNLCLVDVNTNSKLNSSVFDVKRELIKKQELEGHYIPEGTRNVFLKAYTEYPSNNAYWTAKDREGYLNSISRMYNQFVNVIIK